MAGLFSKHEELLRLIPVLQCQKCKNVPGPNGKQKNRYSCFDSSHTLCEKHKTNCPCGSMAGKSPSPVIANLLQNLPWMCQNYKTGCRESRMNEEGLQHHQGKCIYRKVFCPNLGCRRNKKVLFKDVTDHLETAHKLIEYKTVNEIDTFVIKRTKNSSFSNGKYWRAAKLVTSSEALFFVVSKTSNDTVYQWIVFMGSSDEAKNYSYTCSISNDIGQKFLYSGPVHTLDDNSDDIIASGALLTIGFSAAKRSLNYLNQLEVEITIRNLKEEAKDDDMESGVSEGE